jgi:hypothetical protein
MTEQCGNPYLETFRWGFSLCGRVAACVGSDQMRSVEMAVTKRAPKKAPAKKVAPRKQVPVEDEELADLEPVDVPTVDQLVRVFDIHNETAGTWRYKEREGEEGELPISRWLYVKKTAFRELGEPAVLRVTYQAGE